MANIIRLPDEIEALSEKEQRILSRKLLAKFGLAAGDEEIYHAVNTGYVSRLVNRTSGDILKQKAIDEFEENEIVPIFILDSLWGDGLYLVDNEYKVRCLGNDMNAIQQQITPELFSVVSQVPDGTVCFKGPLNTGNSMITTLKNIDYCQIFGIAPTETQYKMSADGTLIIIEFADSESG